MPITEAEFRSALERDPEEALQGLFEAAVSEWMNDGEEEVIRVLAIWTARSIRKGQGNAPESWPRLDFGGVDEIVEYARNRGVIEDDG